MHKSSFEVRLQEQEQNSEQKAEVTPSSQTIANALVKRSVWVVYPDSVRMGLSDENKPAAWFLYSDHAYNWAKSMWEKFYIVERTEIHCV